MNRGAELLRGVPGTQGMKAQRVKVSQAFISALCAGTKTPGEEVRARALTAWGIPTEAWDQAAEADALALVGEAGGAVVADAARAERLGQLANLLTKPGEWRGRATIARLAETWGCSAAEVRELVTDAALVVVADRGPVEVNLQAAIAFYTGIRDKARDNQDFKNALAAQSSLDKLLGVTTYAEQNASDAGQYDARLVLSVILDELKSHPAARAACLARVQAAKAEADGSRAAVV